MQYQNFDLHGVAEIIENDDGSISWLRVPSEVAERLEGRIAASQVRGATGVELRFVIRSGDSATVRMSRQGERSYAPFHVYRGGVQGGNRDHEEDKIVDNGLHGYKISRSQNLDRLKIISEKSGSSFSPEVIRILFDRGSVRIHGIDGDVCPPTPDMLPSRTLLTYGSSITHGSNALTASHTWPSLVAHSLDLDLLNLGLAGSCLMEESMASYVAELGRAGKWQVGILELGVNALSWDEEKARRRSEAFLRTVCEANPDKPILVISPFRNGMEYFWGETASEVWRGILREVTERLAYPNLTYMNGLEALDSIGGISADEIHPSIYGTYRIAEAVTERLRGILH